MGQYVVVLQSASIWMGDLICFTITEIVMQPVYKISSVKKKKTLWQITCNIFCMLIYCCAGPAVKQITLALIILHHLSDRMVK